MARVLHTLRLAVATAELTDGQLLEAYSASRDEAAFAELVRRHGPMVWGVCRRLLANREDAEDAFQATFLVLVRKPGSVRPAERVGSWLHGVAVRAAQKAAQSARRRERQVECLPEPVAPTEELNHDLVAVIDREVARLPPKYRLPVVLCDLEENTRSEAAARLGWPEGTVAGRLALGREMLARRLARLGLAVPSGVLATAISGPEAGATAPAVLLNLTIRAAASGSFRPEAAALANGVIRAMSATRFMPLVAALLIVLGAGLALQGRPGEQPKDPAKAAPAAANAAGPAKAAPAQSWLRETTTGDWPTTWLSPERQVWAFQAKDWAIFIDGCERVKYEYHARRKRIEKTALTESEAQLLSSVDYVSQAPWLFGTERVNSQQRREVTEAGKKWIEYDLVFWRGDMRLGKLRVDPETRLPVSLVLRSQTDAKESMRYEYTSSNTGPADIYALGVPAETKIDDLMPSKEVQQVLKAIAASRSRIGDFRLVVAELREGPDGGLPGGFIVWRKGDRWRIDMCYSENQSDGRTAKSPDGQGWGDPFLEKLKLSWARPLYLCDGLTVYLNANVPWPGTGTKDATPTAWKRTEEVAPPDLLAGEGRGGGMSLASHVKIASLVYPDLSSFPGGAFEFDPRPPAMPGCVLIKCSVRINTREPMTGNEWYYLDPTKGYAVVRVERFNIPVGAKADPLTIPRRQTVRLEDYQLSPQGFWYPGTVLRSNVDLDDTPMRGADAKRKGGPQVRYRSSIAHYHFDFNVALPDSLFAMDEASKSEKK